MKSKFLINLPAYNYLISQFDSEIAIYFIQNVCTKKEKHNWPFYYDSANIRTTSRLLNEVESLSLYWRNTFVFSRLWVTSDELFNVFPICSIVNPPCTQNEYPIEKQIYGGPFNSLFRSANSALSDDTVPICILHVDSYGD